MHDWRCTVTAALRRPSGAFYEDVPKHVRELVDRAEQAEAALRSQQAREQALVEKLEQRIRWHSGSGALKSTEEVFCDEQIVEELRAILAALAGPQEE